MGWLALAVVVGLVAWLVRSTMPPGAKDWDVDAQGPVLVSADGRTLTLTGVPDPAWGRADCFSGLTADGRSAVRGAQVAIWFHLHDVPRQPGGPMGTCVNVVGVRILLPGSLGGRTLTNRHGRPLRTVREADLPWPRQAGLIERPSQICVAGQSSSCIGTMGLVRTYEDSAAQATWTLSQSLDLALPQLLRPWRFTVLARATVNGAEVVCRNAGPWGAEMVWSGAETAQELRVDVQQPVQGPVDLAKDCAVGFDAARTVR